jgi:hypothetical protein
MSFNTWHNRRHDVLRTTMFRKKDFDACAGGLRRFDEDEFVFVGQDHRTRANAVTLIATVLLRPLHERLEPRIASQPIEHSIDSYACRIDLIVIEVLAFKVINRFGFVAQSCVNQGG